MPMLHIRLFGHLSLTCDDSPLALTSARLQSLLAYLLLHGGAPQPRSHVAYLLWPDSSEANARRSLRFLLHQLRRALPDAGRYLEITDHSVQWRPDAPFTLDVLAFERALAEAARPAGARAALERAVALYEGDLLTDCYDDWIFAERERLRQLFIAALAELAALCEREGAYGDAIAYGQRLLRFDPLHEEAYRRLMRLHALNGDRVGALRAYQTCAAVLRRELDVAPSAATQAAYRQLLSAPAPETRATPQPVRSLPHNPPLSLTTFVGRAREQAELARLLARTRLLTLTGPAGVGKTRLALEFVTDLARARVPGALPLPGGAWWVELAALREPAFVAQAVAAVLAAHEQAGASTLESLVHFLRDRELLLVLDNGEHLVEACAQLVDALLRHCPGVRILVTSREVLNVAGERTLMVPPLSLPPDPSAIRAHDEYGREISRAEASEAVQLFVERATTALPTFQLTSQNADAVVQICRRLDGIPLGIELAAARVKLLTVEQVAARLDESLSLLTAGSRSAPPRHRTLRAAIDWSYDLLSGAERELFCRLAVFSGGFTLDAAEQVCGRGDRSTLETLSLLADKSLLVVDALREGEARYGMLETIREYAREKAGAAGAFDELRWKHARYFVALARRANMELLGPGQLRWSARLEQELGNLRAALEYLLASDAVPDRAELALQLLGALNRWWYARGHISEARQWLERALHLSRGQATPARVKALQAAGWLARHQVDLAHAQAYLQEGVALSRLLGDEQGLSDALDSLGDVALSAGDPRRAEAFYQESLALRRAQGRPHFVAFSLNSLGDAAYAQCDYARAGDYYDESLALFRELGDRRGMALATCGFGHVALDQGEHERAGDLLKQSLALFAELGNRLDIAICLEGLARIAAAQGKASRAVRLLGAADTLRQVLGAPPTRDAQRLLDRLLESLRAAVDEPALDALLSEGRALPLPDAVAYALGGDGLT